MIEPLVVIVPVYNAEPTLAKVVKDVRRNLPGALIIGVDDGSTDGSRKLLRTVADETIEFDQNQGKGAALRAGFDAALKKGAAAVLTIDSDGQHDAAFAPAIVGALDRADIVIGTRDLSGKAVPQASADRQHDLVRGYARRIGRQSSRQPVGLSRDQG